MSVRNAFARAAEQHRAALIAYAVAGYPTPEMSPAIFAALAAAGADVIEIGVPFSDPVADGPVIGSAAQVAIEHGAGLESALAISQAMRPRFDGGIVLMGYLNPFLSRGLETFAADAANAGVDGIIVPDLPADETGMWDELGTHLETVLMVAPTTPLERAVAIAKRATGFVYLVSTTGVTGMREALPEKTYERAIQLRAATQTPVAIGFGIGTPELAAKAGRVADGVVVGSAIIHQIADVPAQSDSEQAVRRLVQAIRTALEDDNGEETTSRSHNQIDTTGWRR